VLQTKIISKLDQQAAASYFKKGLQQLKQGELETAKKSFEDVLEINSSHYLAHNNLGVIAFEKKDFVSAIEHYKKSIALYPIVSSVYHNLGLVYFETQKFDEAESVFKKGLRHDPQNPESYFNLANLFLKKEAYENAVIFYNKAISLKPDYFEAYSNLGDIYLINEDFVEARKNYEQALKINPKAEPALEGLKHVQKEESQIRNFKAKMRVQREAEDLRPS
jgi:Tfp pilus assembly protein PilF